MHSFRVAFLALHDSIQGITASAQACYAGCMPTATGNMRIECHAATMTQQGRSSNEDAFLIGHGPIPCAVLCDGAGNAEFAAKRVLILFEKLLGEATAKQVSDPATWVAWIKSLDSSLVEGNQSTFVGVAAVNGVVVGACVGDSRVYLLNREGQCRIVTETAAKHRLGSGQAQPFSIQLTIKPGDILLLLSDGAWMPLNLYTLQKTVVTAAVKHFSDVPAAILDAAGRTGRADDMTAVAVKLVL
jgi:serine/threonine protein phosphatase PrpC